MKPLLRILALAALMPASSFAGARNAGLVKPFTDFAMSFAAADADPKAVASAVAAWTSGQDETKAAALAQNLQPGAGSEKRIRESLAGWKGMIGAGTESAAADLLTAAYGQFFPGAAGAAGAGGNSQQALERVRKLRERFAKLPGKGVFGPDKDAGVPGAGGGAGGTTAGGGRRTELQAMEEARRGGSGLIVPKGKTVAPPTLSETLARSAQEDERLLELGKDDGTWGTAIGRAVTQGKKTGSQLLSYFTSGDTWRRTGQGALEMVSKPGETVRYLPGALKEGGLALWHGFKADISNASDEVGKFIEDPSPYRGMAVVGSVGLAVSNAFVVGGGVKTVVRQGAKTEIVQGTKQASRLADNLLGSLDDSLDFTVQATKPKLSAYQTASRQWKKAKDGAYSVEAGELKGRIGVDQKVYGEVEQVGIQRGSDCARFGITTCSIANGTKTTKAEVEAAATNVMIAENSEKVARLSEKLAKLKASGGDTSAVSQALVEARSQLTMAEVGGAGYYGLSFDSIGATLREMKTSHRSLGYSDEVLRGLRRGETPPGMLDIQRKIDGELLRGNAVMAGLYTGSEGAHSLHAVTILGKGRDAAGKVVYEIYDSNVGRVAQIPADAVKPFGAVVVGRT